MNTFVILLILTTKNKHLYPHQLSTSQTPSLDKVGTQKQGVTYATVFHHQDYQLDKCGKINLQV